MGSGSFGEVFLGEVTDKASGDVTDVILKKRKLSLNAQRVRSLSVSLSLFTLFPCA